MKSFTSEADVLQALGFVGDDVASTFIDAGSAGQVIIATRDTVQLLVSLDDVTGDGTLNAASVSVHQHETADQAITCYDRTVLSARETAELYRAMAAMGPLVARSKQGVDPLAGGFYL